MEGRSEKSRSKLLKSNIWTLLPRQFVFLTTLETLKGFTIECKWFSLWSLGNRIRSRFEEKVSIISSNCKFILFIGTNEIGIMFLMVELVVV